LSRIQIERAAAVLVGCCALYFLYFYGLARTGVLGPDEPRYAAIGRAMAESGDWVTPRLWGEAWYEKPALLYWMTAVGFNAGLGEDLAPRLPVAIASAAFLVFFFVALRQEFGNRPAFYSASILATSAGWLAFSHVALPDLPMSAAFAGCMLLAMRTTGTGRCMLQGALLGVAMLAKGLVPLALFVPAMWWMRHRLRHLGIVGASALAVAAPWYILVAARNGTAFVDEFFWKQQVARIGSASLMHVRPVWFYVPVLLAAIFPWTPMLAVLARRSDFFNDARVRFLAAWFVWGFVLFSAAVNKLPGYLLPLLPALAALVGIGLAQCRPRGWPVAIGLAGSAVLLGCLPTVQVMLPQVLLAGLSRATPEVRLGFVLPALLVALSGAGLERAGYREWAVAVVAIGIGLGVFGFVFTTYPVLDGTASPRGFWRSHAGSITCVPAENRSWRYGLSYYAGRKLPDCN
jgi:4-amino-4-deoxy-L-arabinose transferase-like glycosyltransferase